MTTTTDLQSMKQSCFDFARDLKTGNIIWSIDQDFQHGFKCKLADQSLYVFLVESKDTSVTTEKRYFQMVSALIDGTVLEAQTAKAAAQEAIYLIKAEIHKMLHQIEPKDDSTYEEMANYVVDDMKETISSFVNEWMPDFGNENFDMATEIANTKKEYAQRFKQAFSNIPNIEPLDAFIERLNNLTMYAPANNKHNKTLLEGYVFVLNFAKEVRKEFQQDVKF